MTEQKVKDGSVNETPKVKRKPVLLHDDTVALINIYRKPEQASLEYAFFWKNTGNDPYDWQSEAEDFASQIDDYCCIAFMEELANAFKKRVDSYNSDLKKSIEKARNKKPKLIKDGEK